MRASKGIANLANLKFMFIWLFFGDFFLKKLNLPQMQKVKCKCLHSRQPCKKLHNVCTVVF